jgi:hypothetical protein
MQSFWICLICHLDASSSAYQLKYEVELCSLVLASCQVCFGKVTGLRLLAILLFQRVEPMDFRLPKLDSIFATDELLAEMARRRERAEKSVLTAVRKQRELRHRPACQEDMRVQIEPDVRCFSTLTTVEQVDLVCRQERRLGRRFSLS